MTPRLEPYSIPIYEDADLSCGFFALLYDGGVLPLTFPMSTFDCNWMKACIDALQWQHGFPHSILIPPDFYADVMRQSRGWSDEDVRTAARRAIDSAWREIEGKK